MTQEEVDEMCKKHEAWLASGRKEGERADFRNADLGGARLEGVNLKAAKLNGANLERAKQITHDLQVNDPENCYICPLIAFSYLGYNEIGYDEEMELCIDLLSVSDVLIVASDISDGVQKEIDFAKMVGMEVIDLAEKYRKI